MGTVQAYYEQVKVSNWLDAISRDNESIDPRYAFIFICVSSKVSLHDSKDTRSPSGGHSPPQHPLPGPTISVRKTPIPLVIALFLHRPTNSRSTKAGAPTFSCETTRKVFSWSAVRPNQPTRTKTDIHRVPDRRRHNLVGHDRD